MARSNFSALSSLKNQMTAPRVDNEEEVLVEPPALASPSSTPAVQSARDLAPVPTPTPIAISHRPAPKPTSSSSRMRRTFTGPTIQINADIPKDLHREVKLQLVTEDRSLADLLESVLRDYVNRNKK
jgi:hypothetical protein